MKVWSLRRYETERCCKMQMEALRDILLQYRPNGGISSIDVTPKHPAAPEDESLFEQLILKAKSIEKGQIELSGSIYYWSVSDGGYRKEAVIRTFESLAECIEWLGSGQDAVEECADKFLCEN